MDISTTNYDRTMIQLLKDEQYTWLNTCQAPENLTHATSYHEKQILAKKSGGPQITFFAAASGRIAKKLQNLPI